ncbi:hypothetical protein ACFL0D_09535, partial [Thermoproteota archaeon]
MVGQEVLSQGFQLPLPLIVTLFGGLVSPFVGLLAERTGIKLREAWMIIISSTSFVSVYLLYRQVQATTNK